VASLGPLAHLIGESAPASDWSLGRVSDFGGGAT